MNDPQEESISDQIEDSSSTQAECQETEYEYWDSENIEDLTEFFFEDFDDAYEEYIQASYEVSPWYIEETNKETYGDQSIEQ